MLSAMTTAIDRSSFYSNGRVSGDRLYKLKTQEKYIVLSIDDGPSQYTETILDILNKNQVRANFFLVGSEIESYPTMIKKIKNGGHEIGNHSYTHKDFQKMSVEEMYNNEILAFNNLLQNNRGGESFLVRPPYGSVSPKQIEFLKKKGYYIINWSLDTFDWKYKWNDSLKSVQAKHHKGGIILLHSNKKAPYLLPEIIRELKEEGYTFVTLGQFLKQEDLPPAGRPRDSSSLWKKRREFLRGSIKKEK